MAILKHVLAKINTQYIKMYTVKKHPLGFTSLSHCKTANASTEPTPLQWKTRSQPEPLKNEMELKWMKNRDKLNCNIMINCSIDTHKSIHPECFCCVNPPQAGGVAGEDDEDVCRFLVLRGPNDGGDTVRGTTCTLQKGILQLDKQFNTKCLKCVIPYFAFSCYFEKL